MQQKTVYRKGQAVCGMQSNAGAILGLGISGAPRIVGVKSLNGGASHEGINKTKVKSIRKIEKRKSQACCSQTPVKVDSKRA